VTDATITLLPDGSFVCERWPAWAHDGLRRLAELSEPDVPGRAHARLYPVPADDEERAAEWRRHVHPELFALLASAREVVTKDLATAKKGRSGTIRRLEIPAASVAAWIAALNAARLRLGVEADVDSKTMGAGLADLPEAQREAVALIDFFGWLQQTLIGGVDPEAAS
jgi:hypothetical protein